MNRRRRRDRRRGFTLVEILVALVITVLGLMAIAAMFVSNAQGTGYARRATEASVLGEDQLERLLTTPSADLTSGLDQVDEHGVAVASGGFTRVWTVSWEGDLARIAVSVTWPEGGSTREMVFRTLRSR